MSEGEMAKLMEEVEEKKKLIGIIRNKPWRMKKRLTEFKWVFFNLTKIINLIFLKFDKDYSSGVFFKPEKIINLGFPKPDKDY